MVLYVNNINYYYSGGYNYNNNSNNYSHNKHNNHNHHNHLNNNSISLNFWASKLLYIACFIPYCEP